MSNEDLDAVWEALSNEEKLKILKAHLDDLVARRELWAEEVEGETRYFATRRRLLESV